MKTPMNYTIKLENATVRAELEIELRERQPGNWRRATDLEPCNDGIELSICASTWQRGEYGRWLEWSAGQCIEAIEESFGSIPEIKKLCSIWRRWHLNGMRAGTVVQERALESMDSDAYSSFESHYDRACAHLGSALLYEDRGYRYGTAWLFEPLPEDVIADIQNICGALGAE